MEVFEPLNDLEPLTNSVHPASQSACGIHRESVFPGYIL